MTIVVLTSTVRTGRFIAGGLRGVGVRAEVLVDPKETEAIRIAVEDGRAVLQLSGPALRDLRASGFGQDTIQTAQGMFCFEDLADLVLALRPGDAVVVDRRPFPVTRGARPNRALRSRSTERGRWWSAHQDRTLVDVPRPRHRALN